MSSVIKPENVSIPKVGIFELGKWCSSLADEFSEVYATCFAGPPYFEKYENGWIKEHVYDQHIKHGRIAVALKDSKVIGFTCAKLLHVDKNACYYKHLSRQENLPFDLERSIFITELAVLPEFRNKGLGTALAKHMMCNRSGLHQYDHCITRTAHQGSNSLKIFLEIGANILPGLHYISEDQDEVPSSSEARVYLWRKA